jgi:hypothetical protein
MLGYPHGQTQYVASRIICANGLYGKAPYVELASDLHFHENVEIRRGTVIVYAQQIKQDDKREVCCERLLVLMNDTDERVKNMATTCFAHLPEGAFLPLEDFFRRFIKTSALIDGADNFIEYLIQSDIVTPEEQQLSLSLLKDMLEVITSNLGHYDRGFFSFQKDMTLYLRNLYDRTTDSLLRENTMDLFDEMIRLGSTEALTMLQAEDSEWLPR